MPRLTRKLIRIFVPLTTAAALSGCLIQNAPHMPPAPVESTQSDARAQTLDVGALLYGWTELKNHIASQLPKASGLPSVDSVDSAAFAASDSAVNATLSFFSAPNDSALKLRFALQWAENSKFFIPYAANALESLHSDSNNQEFIDIIDFHAARIYETRAQNDDAADEKSVHLQRAAALYNAVTQNRRSPYYHRARAGALNAQIALGTVSCAALDQFIDDYPDYPGILSLRFERATCRYDAQMQAQAIHELQDLFFWYPHHEISQRAKQWLDHHGLTDRERPFNDIFNRVDQLRKMRFWDDAETAATDAMAQYPESFQLKVQHARIAYERSDHRTAATRFEAILEELNGETKDRLKPSGVIAYLYRAYAYLGDCPRALDYLALNTAKLSHNARHQTTKDVALSCGDFQTAWLNAVQLPLSNDSNALYSFAMTAYLNQKYETARFYFSAAAQSQTGSLKRRSLYFLAQATSKSAERPNDENKRVEHPAETPKNKKQSSKKSKKGRKKQEQKPKITELPAATKERAGTIFKSLIDDNDADYYAILSASRLLELDNQAPDQTLIVQTFPDDVAQPQHVTRTWLDAYTFDAPLDLSTFQRYQTIIPELSRVAFLHRAGLFSERNALFRLIAIEIMGITKLPKRPSLKNLWSVHLSLDGHLVDNRRRETGVWGTNLTVSAFELPKLSNKTQREALLKRQTAIYNAAHELRPFVRQTLLAFHDYYLSRRYAPSLNARCGSPERLDDCALYYPHAFPNAVVSNAKKNHIHPDLIWTLMNIESAFNPDSISIANAYGLLQIIPMTGYKIADALGDAAFGPYDLIRPDVSIRMGTWYFAQILNKFNGYATLSMAAYNGGPHQVARWLTAFRSIDHDAFIELIPYNEARNYVKKGMARLLLFQRIDNGNPSYFFYIPNTLPQDFRPMPNY